MIARSAHQVAYIKLDLAPVNSNAIFGPTGVALRPLVELGHTQTSCAKSVCHRNPKKVRPEKTCLTPQS